jgi:endonuclease YncB( thermonuclease family)
VPKRKKIKIKKNVGWIGLLVLVPSLLLNGWFLSNQDLELPETGKDIVVSVLDGDTFVLPGKQRVRLKRVEAPALEHCGGEEAKVRLEELVLGKEVTLKNIVVDYWRRMVAIVYQDNQLINEILLREGKVAYLGASEEGKAELQEASDYAKENKIGINGEECSPTKPEKEGCLIKGNVAQDSSKTKIYHFRGCSGYDGIKVQRYLGEDWFCSETEAKKAGFVKSKNCFGKKFEK